MISIARLQIDLQQVGYAFTISPASRAAGRGIVNARPTDRMRLRP